MHMDKDPKGFREANLSGLGLIYFTDFAPPIPAPLSRTGSCHQR